jgi:2-iminoacetate synthase ThiH
MAGASTPQQQTITSLENAIREAGREPRQRDSYYRHVLPRSEAEIVSVGRDEPELASV